MFAIAFDLVVADTAQHHPKGVSQAYADIGSALAGFGLTGCKATLHEQLRRPCQPVRRNHGAESAAMVAGLSARHSRFPCRAMVGFHEAGEGVGHGGVHLQPERRTGFRPVDTLAAVNRVGRCRSKSVG